MRGFKLIKNNLVLAVEIYDSFKFLSVSVNNSTYGTYTHVISYKRISERFFKCVLVLCA